jgi:DNA-binding CsgD family transcriptional regulator
MPARIRHSAVKLHRKIFRGARHTANSARAQTSTPKTTLAAKLSDERHRHFVARETELSAFEAALADTSCSLLFMSGPTGVGKTSLLHECQRVAESRGHTVRQIDAGELARRGHEAWQVNVAFSYDEHRRKQAVRPVLLIDGYERLCEDGPWLLDRLGHELPSDTLLVLASRKAPPQWLRLDRAWVNLTRQVEIAPWTEEEALEFLELQGVPALAQRAMQELAQGYPLALAAAAATYHQDCAESEKPRLFEGQQIERVHADLARVLSLGATSRGQQLALDVCSISQSTSVELLDHVLQGSGVESASSAHSLFEWLLQRPYIDRVGSSVRPQLLARSTLLARLRREQRYDALLGPIREFWVNQLSTASAPEGGMRALFFLDRDLPAVGKSNTEPGECTALEVARPTDHDPIVELVRRLDGEESAELCRAHLRAEPEAFEISRNGSAIDRVLHASRLTTPGDIRLHERDPVARLAKQFLREHPPDRGACVLLVRWLMADKGYQSPSPPVLPLLARAAQITMSSPRVSYALGLYRDPEDWQELWDAAGSRRAVVGRVTVDKQSYSLLAFSYTEASLRDLLLDAGRSQSAAARQVPSNTESDQRRKIKQRVATMARSTKLTLREAEVLELLCLGVAPEGIAQQLQIRPRTVKFHQENVLRKTGSATRIELFRRLI